VTAPAPLLAVIAGGKSRRFGRDKTQLAVAGATLLERACAVGLAEGLDVVVIGHDRPAVWPAHLAAVAFHPDARPGLGPLGGIATALALSAGATVIAVAADMPAFDDVALKWLCALDDAPVTMRARIPGHDGLLEPLLALYRPTLLPAISARLERGDLAVHGISAEPGVEIVAAPEWLRGRMVNINTPEDWAGFSAR
jgi:molybdopterin-guanine dinucleotide biosynthesis protein A